MSPINKIYENVIKMHHIKMITGIIFFRNEGHVIINMTNVKCNNYVVKIDKYVLKYIYI